jgi:hypothetical protein
MFGAILLAIVGSWAKEYFADKFTSNKLKNIASPVKLGGMVKVQNWIEHFRQEYDLDRISICQFHNGGQFANGTSMSKFSMTYESTSPGISSIKDSFKNIFTTDFVAWINKMNHSQLILADIKNTKNQKTKDQFTQHGIEYSLTVPIKDISGCLIAFVWIHGIREDFDIAGNTEAIQKINEIKGYIDNM